MAGSTSVPRTMIGSRAAFVASGLVMLLCALSSQSSGASPVPTARWEVVALGTLGGRFSSAVDVNSGGLVVGDAETRAGDSHAFIWRSGRMRDLRTLGGETSSADAVNDRGQVVGTSETRAGATHAFVWRDGRKDLGKCVTVSTLGDVQRSRDPRAASAPRA